MKTRIITAIICTAIFLPFLIFSHTIAFPMVMSFAATVGVYEMLRCLKVKNWFIAIPSYCVSIALPICARIYSNEQAFFNFAHKVLVVFVFYMAVVAVFSKGKNDISDMAMIL